MRDCEGPIQGIKNCDGKCVVDSNFQEYYDAAGGSSGISCTECFDQEFNNRIEEYLSNCTVDCEDVGHNHIIDEDDIQHVHIYPETSTVETDPSGDHDHSNACVSDISPFWTDRDSFRVIGGLDDTTYSPPKRYEMLKGTNNTNSQDFIYVPWLSIDTNTGSS
jgi:hypothetical protein